MAMAYIGLGSNVDDRAEFLRRAVEELSQREGLRVAQCSSLYRTIPWGYTDQPWFLNAVVIIETALEPENLLNILKEIERTVGRTPTFRWGPREIDLDLLQVDDVVLKSPALTIPHPGIGQRAFVLRPLIEVAPELLDPESGRPWKKFWKELTDVDRRGVEVMHPPLV